MNYEKLKGNEGAIVRIMPPACHLNADGEVEDWPNETWTIVSVDKGNATIRSEAGHEFTLNSDHVRGYNGWNVLMHKVEHSLRAGILAAARFCPGVQYDATMPAAGTLKRRAELSLTQANTLRAAFLARHSTPQAKVLRKAGR